MALKITKAADAITVSTLTICLYAQPGIGKTTLAFTAEDPLLLDFDAGAYRATNRKDSVQIGAWADVASMSAEDFDGYKTIIVDTAGRALDCLAADIMRRDPKMKRGSSLALQGFGVMKADFASWLKTLRSFGKDVILIAHSDEQKNGDDVIERLDAQGASKGEIYKLADAMGRIRISDGKRVLNFSPTDTAFGKNPGQLLPLDIPHPDKDPAFMAGVITSIKAKLNAMSAEGAAEQARFDALRETFQSFTDASQFTEQAAGMGKASAKDKALLGQIATVRGYVYDKSAKAFTVALKEAA